MATQIETLRQKASDAKGAYSAEMAKYSEDNLPTAEQAAHVDELRGEMTAAIKAVGDAERFLKGQSDFNDQEREMRANDRQRGVPKAGTDVSQRKTVGQRFVESDGYREMKAKVAPAGRVLDGVQIQSFPMDFGGLTELDQQALVTGTSNTSAGAFIRADRYADLTEYGWRERTVRSLITNLTTTSDLVEYVRETAPTNNAAVVAEATASSGSSGSKPESDVGYELATTPVVTIAHFVAATKQALNDEAQMSALIDRFLREALEEKAEDYIMNAATYGMLNTSGTQSQAWDTDVLRTTRVAKRKVRTVGRRTPTAFILNPEDWETIELKRDNQNRFYGNGPFGTQAPTLWGLPVVESEAIAVGTGLVGDFRACAAWDREQSSVSVSNSHLDFFTRNLVAILAELRMAFAVLKPTALVEIDLTA